MVCEPERLGMADHPFIVTRPEQERLEHSSEAPAPAMPLRALAITSSAGATAKLSALISRAVPGLRLEQAGRLA